MGIVIKNTVYFRAFEISVSDVCDLLILRFLPACYFQLQ